MIDRAIVADSESLKKSNVEHEIQRAGHEYVVPALPFIQIFTPKPDLLKEAIKAMLHFSESPFVGEDRKKKVLSIDQVYLIVELYEKKKEQQK